jgi:Cu(I)/Ag(I) efflux system membrane fusion protein
MSWPWVRVRLAATLACTVIAASLVLGGLPAIVASPAAAAGGTPLYYQDPDGKPAYAASPTRTLDGRDYKPVYEDVPAAQASAATPPAPRAPGRDRKLLYYRNPMGLPDTSPTPKNDSMGMAYLPVFADEDAAGDPPGTVRITPSRMQTLGVRTGTVEMRPAAARSVRATGTVQFDERHLATVTTKVAGWVERLAVSAMGDPVRRGQVLAELYAPELVVAEKEYLVAARMGGDLQAASVSRLRALDVPEDEIARLRRTGAVTRRIAVRAQANGVVTEKLVQEGMRIGPGEPLYKTADLSTVWLVADVQEQDLGAVQPGQKAAATFVAYPGRTFEGTVEFIYPVLSAATRTGRVRVVVANPDLALRSAMYAAVQIDAPAGSGPVMAVPNSAVIDSGARQVVLVDRGEGRFEPRPVRLGTHGDDWVQVLDGVKPGERVVVGANFLIDAESNLRAALQGFSPGAPNPTASPQPGASR